MAEMQIESNIVHHEKVEKFMKETALGRAPAIGYLVMMWAWCSENAVEGVLPKLTDWEIAAACKYSGDHRRFVTALVECGFLDRGPEALEVHNWREYIPPAIKEKIKYERKKSRGKNGGNSREIPGETAGKNVATGESLSLPVSKPLEDLKTTTETKRPAVKETRKEPVEQPVHVQFVDRFKAFYEKKVGRPFKYGRAQFVLASKLIKDHGAEETIGRTLILAKMCEDRSMWFTKNGWADFSIEKLSNQWNAIIGQAVIDKNAEFQEQLRKVREQRERIDQRLAKR